MPGLECHPWTRGWRPRKESRPDKAFFSAPTFVECVLLAPEAPKAVLPSHQSHTCPKAKPNFICSAKPFFTASSQCYSLIHNPKAQWGSWGCPKGQREGVGSVPRGVGKTRLRQQRPKPAWALFQFPLGAQGSRRQSPGLSYKSGYIHLKSKIRIYPAPLGLLVSAHLAQGTHPALRKTGMCFWEHIYLRVPPS